MQEEIANSKIEVKKEADSGVLNNRHSFSPPSPAFEFPAIEQAKNILTQLDEKAKAIDERIRKLDSLVAKQMLAGRAFAGGQDQPPTKEEIEKDEVRKFLKGTGLDPFKK